MKRTGRFLSTVLCAAVLLAACLQGRHPHLDLDASFTCEEYCWDGEDEDGEWISGSGTTLTFDGRLEHNPALRLEWERLVAHIDVYDGEQVRYRKEIPFKLRSGGSSTFHGTLELEEIGSPGCSGYKYSVVFQTPQGEVIAHRGDFAGSTDQPLPSDDVPTPDLTQDASLNTVFTAVWQTLEAAPTPSSTPSP